MAFDEGLAERVRALLTDRADAHERKMFGGLCFLCGGNMACGIVGDELMVRVGPDAWSDALQQPHAREMDFTGRSLKGMVFVAADGFAQDEDLAAWVRAERDTPAHSHRSSRARPAPPRRADATVPELEWFVGPTCGDGVVAATGPDAVDRSEPTRGVPACS